MTNQTVLIDRQTLINEFQKRLDSSAANWRNTRTHQLGLIREAETSVWEEVLEIVKHSKPHNPSEGTDNGR